MEQTECSETSAYKIQTSGNHPEENIQPTEHGESLKSRIIQIRRIWTPYGGAAEDLEHIARDTAILDECIRT
jgi:hypothetical protein